MLEVSLVCLAMNVYYEARNQSVEAQIAVSEGMQCHKAGSSFRLYGGTREVEMPFHMVL